MKDKAVDYDPIELSEDLFADSFKEMIKQMGNQKEFSQDICKSLHYSKDLSSIHMHTNKCGYLLIQGV